METSTSTSTSTSSSTSTSTSTSSTTTEYGEEIDTSFGNIELMEPELPHRTEV